MGRICLEIANGRSACEADSLCQATSRTSSPHFLDLQHPSYATILILDWTLVNERRSNHMLSSGDMHSRFPGFGFTRLAPDR